MNSRPMRISGFARAAGVGVETVRYYQRRGLLPVPRASGSQRIYDDKLLQRLRFIRKLQGAGFTLREISELLRLDRTRERGAIRNIAATRLAEINARMTELREVTRSLEALLHECCHGEQAAPCPIIEAFDP